MNLHEKAIQAWLKKEKEQARIEAENKTRIEKVVRAAFLKDIGVEPDKVEGNVVTVDDLTIRAVLYYGDVTHFNLRLPCDKCGELTWDACQIHSLAELGKVLESPEPIFCPECRDILFPSSPSPAEEFMASLVSLLENYGFSRG